MHLQEARTRLELHPKQQFAFESKGTERGYGGAAGGGKSFLLRAVAIWACSQVPGIQVYLFRKHYDELIRNHVDGPGGFREALRPWTLAGKCEVLNDRVRFWNDSQIHLCHCSQQKDLEKYLGPEMPVLLIDQAEQFPERWLRYLRHRVRMPLAMKERIDEELRDRFPLIIYSFNPGGLSSGYFRKQFVKAAKPYEIWKTPQKEGGFLRQFIPAYLQDNPSLDEEEYTGALMGLNDEQLTKALLEGNFDALVGNYFTQYDETKHVIPDIDLNSIKHWFKYHTFDWGSSDPFAFYSIAVSDGEKFKSVEGKDMWVPRGSLVFYHEWYGCHPTKASQGLELRNEEIAKGIKKRIQEQTSGLILTDNLPFQDRGYSKNKTKYTIADEFLEHGVRLTLGNTSRIYGWKQVRDRLIGKDGFPFIYFCESCTYARDYLPAIPRDDTRPEDAVDSGETTHSPDAIRLACAAKPLIIDAPPLPKPMQKGTIVPSPVQILKRLKQESDSGFGRR